MRFNIPGSTATFDIPDQWWEASGMQGYSPNAVHYRTTPAWPTVIAIRALEPPVRDGGVVWFRDQETVVQILHAMRDGDELPPIMVWSREKTASARYKVRDGLHRFYLSVALGFTRIPIKIEDFDLDEFLENEARGSRLPPPGDSR